MNVIRNILGRLYSYYWPIELPDFITGSYLAPMVLTLVYLLYSYVAWRFSICLADVAVVLTVVAGLGFMPVLFLAARVHVIGLHWFLTIGVTWIGCTLKIAHWLV